MLNAEGLNLRMDGMDGTDGMDWWNGWMDKKKGVSFLEKLWEEGSGEWRNFEKLFTFFFLSIKFHRDFFPKIYV